MNKNYGNITSDFNSPCHRIYDLELASNESVRSHDYVDALEKLTEIVDDISERKVEYLYEDVMKRTEVTRLLLLLLLDLPPSRQSPSHIKLLEKYTWERENSIEIEMAAMLKTQKSYLRLDDSLVLPLEGLVNFCQNLSGVDCDCIREMCDEISQHHFITMEQNHLLDKIVAKFTH